MFPLLLPISNIQLFSSPPTVAFIAALYIDKDLEFVHTFMNVCFFPRLKVSSSSSSSAAETVPLVAANEQLQASRSLLSLSLF